MAHDREVGGIRCSEVLDHLSEYLDDEADEALRGRVEAHLRGCDWCERFGGQFGEVVGQVRKSLGDEPESMPPDVADRLSKALDDADPSGGS